jgi:sulfonate transport system permease protein
VLRYVPILALQPLLLLWLGVGQVAKVALLAIGVAFPVYVNTYAAVRGLDARYHELADVLRLTHWQRLRRIVAPGALGGFLVGFRYAAAVAWLLLIVAEQINTREGLGQLMVRAQAFGRTERIVVVILVYTVLGVVFDIVIRAAERWLLRWRVVRR